MTPGVLTFYWGIRGAIGNAGHHTIYLPTDYGDTFKDLFTRRRMPDELAFYVSIPSATDAGLAPPGCSAIFVLVPTPLLSDLGRVDWPRFTADVRRKVLERLSREGVVLSEAQFEVEEVYTPEDWRARFGLYDGSAFGAAHTLLQLGPRRAPDYHGAIAGLFYTGAGTTPGTGVPMVVLSGKMVAERVRAAARGRSRDARRAIRRRPGRVPRTARLGRQPSHVRAARPVPARLGVPLLGRSPRLRTIAAARHLVRRRRGRGDRRAAAPPRRRTGHARRQLQRRDLRAPRDERSSQDGCGGSC